MHTRFFNSIKSCGSAIYQSSAPGITACTILACGTELVDFICRQEMLSDSVDWNYFSEARSRIAALVLGSLFLGTNFHFLTKVIKSQTSQSEQLSEQEAKSNKLALKKIFIGSSIYATSLRIAELSLLYPSNLKTVPYLLCDSLCSGVITGSLLSTTGYFLQKTTFTIRPFTKTHFKYMGVGVAVQLVLALLDYLCTKRINDNNHDLDTLIEPKIFAWYLLNTMQTGVFNGLAAVSLKKYSRSQLPNFPHAEAKRIRKMLFGLSSFFNVLTTFLMLALKSPINSTNAAYITCDAFVRGVPAGLLGGASSYVMLKLFKYPEVYEEEGVDVRNEAKVEIMVAPSALPQGALSVPLLEGRNEPDDRMMRLGP